MSRTKHDFESIVGLHVSFCRLNDDGELGLELATSAETTAYLRVWAASYRLEVGDDIVVGGADDVLQIRKHLALLDSVVDVWQTLGQVAWTFASGATLRLFATHSQVAMCWVLSSGGDAFGSGMAGSGYDRTADNEVLLGIAAECNEVELR